MNIFSKLPQRMQDNLAAFAAQAQAKQNLDNQLSIAIKQKQAGQTWQPNPSLGMTSAPFKSLDPYEQRFIADNAMTVAGGISGGLKAPSISARNARLKPDEIVGYLDNLDKSQTPYALGIVPKDKKAILNEPGFILKKVKIKDVIKNDRTTLKDYITEGDQRYDKQLASLVNKNTLENPIIIGKYGLIDGQNRILTKLQNGDEFVNAYVSTSVGRRYPQIKAAFADFQRRVPGVLEQYGIKKY